MADRYPKSKLKRKKPAVVEINQADVYQRESLQKLNIAYNSPVPIKDVHTDSSKANRGTVSPTLTWWTRNNLNVSEKLWASTIEAALPLLGSELWDPLPEPSAVTPRQSERQRHVPANEVPPFPEPSRPPGSPLQSSPRPIRIVSPPRPIDPSPPAAPVVTPPPSGGGGGVPQVPEETAASRSASPPQRREYSRPKKEVAAGRGPIAEKTSASGDLAERPARLFPLWGGAAPRAKEAPLGLPNQADPRTSSGVRRRKVQAAEVEQRVVVVVEEEEAGPSGAQREDGGEVDGPEEVQPGAGAAGGGAGGGGAERLLCCPMCTLVFPSRFSQMDCDSHLAQCLSEMNVDMAW